MSEPIFLLSPPRSFSSVVSYIISQHPELYYFPELHLIWCDDVEEVLSSKSNITQSIVAPSGLLRTVAQIHQNVQNSTFSRHARMWLTNHRHYFAKQLFNYMCDAHSPKLCIEKTPRNTRLIDRVIRLFKLYPNARVVHLTRCAVDSSKLFKELFEHRDSNRGERISLRHLLFKDNYVSMWHATHKSILKFRSIIPLSRILTIRGASIMAEPKSVLPYFCERLSNSTDDHNVIEMLHPERSPYAFFEPRMAPCGYDPKFITNPKFRPMRKKDYSAEQVHSHLNSSDRSNFTRYYIEESMKPSSISRLQDWNHSLLELVLHINAQLGYA